MAKTVKYTKGSAIFLEGEMPKYVYILRDGSIEISRVTPDTERTVYKTVKKGFLFGIKNILVNMPYTSTAITTEDSTVILLSANEFRNFILNESKENLAIIKNISNQLKEIHGKLYAKFESPREKDCERGILLTARSFLHTKEYQSCQDMCEKILSSYPNTKYKSQVDEMLEKIEKEKDKETKHHKYSETATPAIILPDSFKRYEKTIPARKVIFSEFEKGDSLFLVQSGVVRSAKCINGININVSLAKPGEFFGLNAFVDMDVRDVTCITTDDTNVLEFPVDDFQKIISENSEIAFMFLKQLSKRVYLDRKILQNTYIKDYQLRIKDMIYTMEKNGLCEKIGAKSRKIDLTADNISVWTNIDKDVIQKQLDVLETHGIIHQSEEGWFTVKDIERCSTFNSHLRYKNSSTSKKSA